jgi:hypothetical protein
LKKLTLLLLTATLMLPTVSCRKAEPVEEKPAGAPAVTFTVYTGARYLPELTELFKKGAAASMPGTPVAPQVLYDTDAPLEAVAEFYAKNNGFPKVWPDATGDFNTAQPQAYYRSGDHATDLKAIQPLLDKLNMKVDASKAVGPYKGAQINGNGHPRVTLTRPYFDLIQQKVVDRTLIIMAQE